jgi:lysophospholipase L1-like esterase
VIYLSSDGNADRWRIPEAVLRIRGLKLTGRKGNPASVVPATAKPKSILFFGDSITEGAWVSGTSFHKVNGKYVDWVRFSDASLAWPRIVADTFDAEYGVCAFGGTGWITPADPYVPPMPSSWDLYFARHSRLIDGMLTPNPDMVIVNLGTNDGNRQTSSAIRLWLKEVRRSLAPKTPVILIVPFGQMNRSNILDAVSHQTDPYVFVVDLGSDAAKGLKEYGRASSISFDGLHPNAAATPVFATEIAKAIRRTVGIGLRGR